LCVFLQQGKQEKERLFHQGGSISSRTDQILLVAFQIHQSFKENKLPLQIQNIHNSTVTLGKDNTCHTEVSRKDTDRDQHSTRTNLLDSIEFLEYVPIDRNYYQKLGRHAISCPLEYEFIEPILKSGEKRFWKCPCGFTVVGPNSDYYF